MRHDENDPELPIGRRGFAGLRARARSMHRGLFHRAAVELEMALGASPRALLIRPG